MEGGPEVPTDHCYLILPRWLALAQDGGGGAPMAYAQLSPKGLLSAFDDNSVRPFAITLNPPPSSNAGPLMHLRPPPSSRLEVAC